MDNIKKLAIYKAQTKNVRELERAWKAISRQINYLIIRGNEEVAIEVNTKLLAIVYCAVAEATFSKMIHTPHGFTLDQIKQIKFAAKAKGRNRKRKLKSEEKKINAVKIGWLKCAELAVQNISRSGNHSQNVFKKLTKLIDDYIFDPSLIRNKLAHGQWSEALNGDNTDINIIATRTIADLDVVELYRRKKALEKLAGIVEDIIESPNKAHYNDYHLDLANFDKEQKEMSTWTYQKKVEKLLLKKSFKGLG